MDSDDGVIVEKTLLDAANGPATMPCVRKCIKAVKRTAKVASIAYRTYTVVVAAYHVYHVMSSITV
jgi:hypothetical protein